MIEISIYFMGLIYIQMKRYDYDVTTPKPGFRFTQQNSILHFNRFAVFSDGHFSKSVARSGILRERNKSVAGWKRIQGRCIVSSC
jgi:hypothetical protein